MPTDATAPFTMGTENRTITLRVRRQTGPVDLVVRAANKEKDDEHWSAQLPLPALFDVLVVHKQLFLEGVQSVVSEFLIEDERGSRCKRVSLAHPKLKNRKSLTLLCFANAEAAVPRRSKFGASTSRSCSMTPTDLAMGHPQ